MKHNLILLFSVVSLYFVSCGNNYQKEESILEEWSVGYSEGNIDNNVWGGDLYCYDNKIVWHPNKANEVVSQYFHGGKTWELSKKDIEYIGIKETYVILEGVPITTSSVEIISKQGKKYYLRTNLGMENNDLMNYLIDTYQTN